MTIKQIYNPFTDELDSVLNLDNPLLFKGEINSNSDFPTSSDVKNGWFYTIGTDVTDNDASKTNTGQSFVVGDEIVWDGSVWVVVGNHLTTAHTDLTDMPSSSNADHDGRYYTESELDTFLGLKADKSNVLELDNTDAFTPDADYEPSTKKYVDDAEQGIIGDYLDNHPHQDVTTTASPTFEATTLSDNSTDPILNIEAVHATAYNPEIHFKTDNPSTTKFTAGVYGGNDSFYLSPATSINAAQAAKSFIMDYTTGNIGIGGSYGTNSKIKASYTETNGPTANGIIAMQFYAWQNSTVNGSHPVYGIFGYSTAYPNNGVTNSGTCFGGIMYAFKRNYGTISNVTGLTVQFGKYLTNSGIISNRAVGLSVSPMKGNSGGVAGSTNTLAGIAIWTPSGDEPVTNEHPIMSYWVAPSFFRGDIQFDSDSKGAIFGGAQDASIIYDGTNMVIDTSLVAPSDLDVDCGTNKTLELQETVWDDQQVDLANVRLGASAPSWTAYKGAQVLAFDKNQDNKISFNMQLTHKYKLGTNIEFHIHNTPSDDTAGDVRWVLTVTHADIGSDFPAESTYTAVQTIDANTADKHILFEIDDNIGSGSGVSSVALMSLTRTGTHADDDYDNDIYLVALDAHIEIDTMGSRQETTK